jgi:hypothetical protein
MFKIKRAAVLTFFSNWQFSGNNIFKIDPLNKNYESCIKTKTIIKPIVAKFAA